MILLRFALPSLAMALVCVAQASPSAPPAPVKPYNPASRNASPANGSATPGQTRFPLNVHSPSAVKGARYRKARDEAAKQAVLEHSSQHRGRPK